jgi:hypothetical protein
MIKLLAYKYPNSIDVDLNRKLEPVAHICESNSVSTLITELLFKHKHNYVLTKLNGSLYICEPINHKKMLYTNRKVFYHPHQNLLD